MEETDSDDDTETNDDVHGVVCYENIDTYDHFPIFVVSSFSFFQCQ